jgi:hypothetical protein
MERLQELLAEAERLAKEIEALLAESQSEVGAEGEEATPLEAEAQASRQRKLNKLVTRSKKVADEIESAKAAMESAKSLRAVADRCKPAPEVVRDDAARIEPVSYRGRLKAGYTVFLVAMDYKTLHVDFKPLRSKDDAARAFECLGFKYGWHKAPHTPAGGPRCLRPWALRRSQ